MLAILMAAWELADRKALFPSGTVLGLALMKFHLVLLWPLALAAQRRWRMLGGLAVSALILLALSFACVGTQGLRDYVALLAGPGLMRVAPDPARQFGTPGFLSNLGIASAGLRVALAAVIAILTALAAWRGEVRTLFIVVPVASLSIVPHVLYYDPTLILLSLWIALGLPELRSMAVALLFPFVFAMASAPKPYTILFSLGGLVFLSRVLWISIPRGPRPSSSPDAETDQKTKRPPIVGARLL